MSTNRIAVIDYGMGNVWSVMSALGYLGTACALVSNADEIRTADNIVLPGVGSFKKAMTIIQQKHFDEAIREAVHRKGAKILGICLGMQLLGQSSTEDGYADGLGLIPNRVEKFTADEVGNRKIPHVGFNAVVDVDSEVLFKELPSNPDFYFVHSYRMLPEDLERGIAVCQYGQNFLAAFENGNIFGTQFHPEKSQTNGLVLLNNFLKFKAC